MFKHTLFAIIAVLTAALAAVQQAKAAEPRSVEVEGTQFKVTLTDGHVLRSAELVGAPLTISTAAGALRQRIDGGERGLTAEGHRYGGTADTGARRLLREFVPPVPGRRRLSLAFRPVPTVRGAG